MVRSTRLNGTVMKTGDPVVIGYGRKTVPGRVLIVSPNGKSLMLSFDAMLGGHIGMMPVLQNDDGSYVSIIEGKEVRLDHAD
jgi:hypothetical protein